MKKITILNKEFKNEDMVWVKYEEDNDGIEIREVVGYLSFYTGTHEKLKGNDTVDIDMHTYCPEGLDNYSIEIYRGDIIDIKKLVYEQD